MFTGTEFWATQQKGFYCGIWDMKPVVTTVTWGMHTVLQLSMSRTLVQMSVRTVYPEAFLIFSELTLERAMIAFPSLSRDSRRSGFCSWVWKPVDNLCSFRPYLWEKSGITLHTARLFPSTFFLIHPSIHPSYNSIIFHITYPLQTAPLNWHQTKLFQL